jgi:tRNA pseudouridine38-40 synthase
VASESRPSRSCRYRATVQYEGTGYNGFQRQRRGVPSVQAELEKALALLTDGPVRVIGAGRTDAGVHALGQVIGFTIEWPAKHGLQALTRALNAKLPQDIAIVDLEEAPPGFHPRFDAHRRTYEYNVLNTPIRQPLLRQRAWHVAEVLNVEHMNTAAAQLLGTQDFVTFGRAPVGENTVREVFEATWRRDGQMLVFRISANAFLFRMVRSLVGSLRAVGGGKWTVDDFAAALGARDRQRSAPAAPAHGLYLLSVEYEN